MTKLFILTVLLVWNSLLFAADPISKSNLERKWSGSWNEVNNLKKIMPEEEPFIPVNIYNVLEISNVNKKGFNYRNVGNDVGYGPNEVTYHEGLAVYTKDGHAKDEKNMLLLHFTQGGKKWDRGLTLVTKDNSKSYFKQKRTVFEAGFNCEKAGTHIERKICTHPILAKADKEMGVLYSTLRKKLRKKKRNKLRKSQRNWMKKRNKQCQNKIKADEVCLSGYYASRLLALRKMHDPTLGKNKILDTAYIKATYNNYSELWRDTVFRLTLIHLEKDNVVQEWMMYKPEIKAKFSTKEAVFTGFYQYETIIWPDNVVVSKAFQIVIDDNAKMWISVAVDKGKGFIVNTLGSKNRPSSVQLWMKENKENTLGCDLPVVPMRCRK